MDKDWSVSIIMPHRPLSTGSLSTPAGPLIQEPDGRWRLPSGEIRDTSREDIERGIFFIEKNSRFRHRIVVAIDHDVFPHENWLKEFPNVRIVRSQFVARSDHPTIPYCRLAAAYRDAIATVPDEEWICYGFTSDLIVCEDWDWYIQEAIREYGPENVYVPMFVEMRSQAGTQMEYEIKGTVPTPYQIWVEFREKICCHGLSWPTTINSYVTEEDFNAYIEIMRRGNVELGVPEVIFEQCGERGVGYYNVMFMKARYAKIAGFDVERGMGFDIGFDDALRDTAHRLKGVVTRTAVYHPQAETYTSPFQWK